MCVCVGDKGLEERELTKTDLAASYGNGDKEGGEDGQEGINDQRRSTGEAKVLKKRGNLEGEHVKIF